MLKAVMIPFPIGLLYLIDNFKIALNVDLQIKSKCGVLPLITHPKAIKPSNFLCFFYGDWNFKNTWYI